MIGDSFSNAYSDMVMGYSKNSTVNIIFRQFARGQCPSLLGYGPDYCRKIVEEEKNFIVGNQSVKTVVMAANWPAYFNGKDYGWLNYSESATNFYNAFVRTVEFYKNNGKRVVVLLAPPVGYNPKSCVNRGVKLSSIDRCTLPLGVAKENDGQYRGWMLKFLTYKNVKVFDPFRVMCRNNYCATKYAGKILSADGNHLSVYGGEYLAIYGEHLLDNVFIEDNVQ